MTPEVGPLLRCAVDVSAGRATIRASGELDYSSLRLMIVTVTDALASRAGELVLDLTAVTFCSTGSASMLHSVRRQAEAAGSRLIVLPSRHVRHVLELTDLAQNLDLRDQP